ncbi:hypothetical protein [Halopelagius longus]|uniref:Rubrerythrin-like domain-containing protein n=1 Tax=Halopelagius longus TaxID=1236180 RepID=A0A1H1ACH0_9EURY|nr:hypothetical protein [Halopelagius longus]SDQ37270.1 hypothetical protein SAMN05216278_1267 [Halopelagius longus]
MSERVSFVCRECGARVSPGSFRANCPNCGGELGPDAEPRAAAGD